MTVAVPPALAALVRGGAMDAELAALLWLVMEAGMPATVVGPEAPPRMAVRDALGVLRAPDIDAGGGAATVEVMAGDRLEDVLGGATTTSPSPGGAPGARPGIVVVLGETGVVAVHWLRPPFRDAHGHVQQLPPAVLAARDPRTGRIDHFAWGVATELGAVTGHPPMELEREQARRAVAITSAVRDAV